MLFDNAHVAARTYSEGHPMEYNAVAAADSFNRVHAFLGQWLH